MNLKRVGILFARELRASAGNFLIVFSIIAPIAFSLLINLFFGDLFSGKPVLGFLDPYNSRFTAEMSSLPYLKTSRYESLDEMIADVDQGVIETGYVVPSGFDEALRDGIEMDFLVYTWGETALSNRLIADTAIANVVMDIAGLEKNVTVEVAQPGQTQQTSLADQLLPFLILMTIMLGGILVPGLSMITEKQTRTLTALNVTPLTLPEIFAAKVLLGVTMGTSTGLITLALNRALGSHPLLLVFVIMLDAFAASLLGILLGALLKDMNMLLATLKGGGLLMTAPAILELIPKAPDWIVRLFPTYYVFKPVIEVAEHGAGLSEIWGDLLVLLVIIAMLVAGLASVIRRQQRGLALL